MPRPASFRSEEGLATRPRQQAIDELPIGAIEPDVFLSDPLQALRLVGEGPLDPRLAIDFRFHFVRPRI